jgi:two-component system chemotaxis response regulator CheY
MDIQRQKPTLLIIEDHRAMRILMGLSLKKEFNIITQSNGIEALAWLSKTAALPDLIILDLQMPLVDGFKFLTQIRSSGLFRSLPVLLVSGSFTHEEMQSVYDLGVSGFVKKPFNIISFKEKVHMVLENADSEVSV